MIPLLTTDLSSIHSQEDSVGYYQVGDKKFIYKIPALIEATKTKADVRWNFHRSVFDKVRWNQSFGTDLRTLYGRRARQLREKYEHLTLHYSGGSDSYTVLRSFIDNKIKLDEIYVRWPIKATENMYKANSLDKRPSNILSEWDLVIKPDLDYLKIYHPEIKITVHDWSDDLHSIETFPEGLIETVGADWLNFGSFIKHRLTSDSEKQWFDKKTTASIFALDKCQIMKKGSNAYLYFSDSPLNITSRKDKNVEAFYWSPDLPEIALEQAHALLNYFNTRPELHKLIDADSPERALPENVKCLDSIIRSLIYPDWNPNKFQANKPQDSIFMENDAWMFETFNDTRTMDSWQWNIDNLMSQIDKKYFRFNQKNLITGMIRFISPLYKIGNFTQVDH